MEKRRKEKRGRNGTAADDPIYIYIYTHMGICRHSIEEARTIGANDYTINSKHNAN